MTREKNLEAIRQRDEELYNYLAQYDMKNKKTEVLTAKNGDVVISYDGVLLNSSYNPTREAEKFMSDYVKIPDATPVVMMGISNAIYIKTLISSNATEYGVMIYEPSTEIFIECINNVDISDLILNNNIFIAIGGKKGFYYKNWFDENIFAYNYRLAKLIILPKYKELFVKEYNEINEAFLSKIATCSAVEYTAINRGKKVCENSIKNIKFINNARSSYDYKGIFKDMPAIVVAAGPSLEKNAHLLNEVKGRALVIAVDSAIPYLMNNNIIPDLIMSIDYVKPVKLFEDERVRKIPFVFGPNLNNEVLEQIKFDNLIVGNTEYNLWRNLARVKGSDLEEVLSGGSVATEAIGMLEYWGVKNIILIGQDLALAGKKMHAGTADDILKTELKNVVMVKGIDGNEIETQKDFYIYLRWIENFAYNVKDHCTIIDATEGGAFKENTVVMTLREAIDKYCNKEYNIFELLMIPKQLDFGNDYASIIDELRNMIVRCRNLSKLCASGAADCTRAKNMLAARNYDVKLLKKLNSSIAKLDNAIESASERDFYLKYSYEIEVELLDAIYEEYDSDDIEATIKLYENSAKYYNGVEKAGKELIEIVSSYIEELKAISG